MRLIRALATAHAIAIILAVPCAAHTGSDSHSHLHGGLTVSPDVTVLLSERIVDVSRAFTTETRIHEKVLLETPEAVANFTEVQVAYNSASARVRVLMVRRLRPDGKGHYIATSFPARGTRELEERYEEALIDAVHVDFVDCEPGDIIEYELVKSEAPVMPGRFFTTMLWQTEYKTAASRLVLTVPTGMAVESKCWGMTVTPTVDEVRNKTRYEWTVDTPMPAYDRRSQPVQPCVVAGTPTTWSEVSEWYERMLYPVLDPSAAVREKARELVGSAQDTPEKIAAIADFVCNTIHTEAVETGALAWRPSPGDRVLTLGEADCKGKAALLCAMLKSVGVIAQPALTYTATACPTLADQLPNPFAFNHVVVAVSGPGNAIWIDPTQMAAKVHYNGFPREVMLLGSTPMFASVSQFTNY